MGRKKKPQPDDQEQFARFVKKAKEIQKENADEVFEEAVKTIIKKKKIKKS